MTLLELINKLADIERAHPQHGHLRVAIINESFEWYGMLELDSSGISIRDTNETNHVIDGPQQVLAIDFGSCGGKDLL